MKRKINEWMSVQIIKNPGRVVLIAILLFNVAFFLLSAAVISALSLDGTEKMGFIEAAFCTITMILDAGCIQFVVADIGQSGIVITVICLLVVLIGMISFTGAVIGYITNYISHFIEDANTGDKKLAISNHFVIINWNTRASEIINDMLYCDEKQKVVVLVTSRKEEIEKEIEERLSDTVQRERQALVDKYSHLSLIPRCFALLKNRFKRNVTVVVREGDVFSLKQLKDISLERARSVMILGNDINNTLCKFEHKERAEEFGKGNALTIKTLMQVCDIMGDEKSFDKQRVIVEITDKWTWELVQKIISAKQVDGKCNIIPIRINEILGQILAQFCLMPELNEVYSELFSSRGAEFYTERQDGDEDEISFATEYLKEHNHALPITVMKNDGKTHRYYVADSEKDINKVSWVSDKEYRVRLNRDYWIEKKNIIILGHNSKCREIMAGFTSFNAEWQRDGESIIEIVVIDDKKSLEKMNYYKDYPFVIKTVEADIYDKNIICSTIDEFVSANEEDTSVLILSDDAVLNENIDANALASLVYVHDIIQSKINENPDFDVESIDVIVEIIDPKHHDIINNYSVNNVVISNRYISKMITQLSEVEGLFDFYHDILTYDTDGGDSKEIYIRKLTTYFEAIPVETTADKLIRAVYKESLEMDNPSIVLGYVKPGGKVVIFGGDQAKINVKLEKRDKLIVFASH